MKSTFDELSQKEVINVCDGKRLGCVEDLELNLTDGKIIALIVPGPARFFGLIRGEQEYVIPYGRIVKIGDDVILVEYANTNSIPTV